MKCELIASLRMNLQQPLPSSCYLSSSKNATAPKPDPNSLTPKLHRRKNRLHLGATKVDPSLFQKIEKESEKKRFTFSETNRSRVDNDKTHTKFVTTEEQDSEEESDILKDELERQERLKERSDNRNVSKHSISHNVNRSSWSEKEVKENAADSAGYHQMFKNLEPSKPKYKTSSTDEAQKKFVSAKAISSQSYFNDIEESNEYKSDLSRFSNCTSISSDDLFNREPYEANLPDLFFSSIENISYEELATCLRNGVTKVAEKLGSALSSLASRLPHEFGEY